MMNIEKKFKRPDHEYRSAPFWSWNEDLKVKHLKYQLEQMKKGGMAGGFMHSRIGLITPYFSKEWMDCVKETVKHAKKIRIPIYLYDEDRWPSGFAGGIVTKNKKYAMKALKVTRLGSKWEFKTLTIPPTEWFNNSGYLDTLSKEAVGEFIKSTYVTYRKIVGNEFNRIIPAIFTDEPNFMPIWSIPQPGKKSFYLPWTDRLNELFRQRYGYELKGNYISLVEDIGDYKKIRYHYRRLITELFIENFGKQIYDWCEENDIAFTGHYLEEDTLARQTRVIGAAMPLYEYMQMPGIDHLCRQLETGYLAIKQCSSVAHQLGKKRVLSELFGCSGQNMTFIDRKWIGNWNTALGVNFFCPHLWLYSMGGYRKRDYPPTLSYQQPYWRYNRFIEDYFAHINFITSQGRFHSDILVIHPIESAWCQYSPTDIRPVEKINDKFVYLLKKLSGEHYDYDLGDESIISRWGSYSKEEGEAVFKVGKMSYKVVIIPPVISLRKTTVELLTAFLNKGGKAIGFKHIPDRLDGEDDKNCLIEQLYRKVLLCRDVSYLISLLESLLKKDIYVIDDRKNEIEDIYYQHRVINDGTDVYFLVNNNKDKDHIAKIKIPYKDKTHLEIWDPVSGDISILDKVKQEDGYFSTCLYFPRVGSHILVRSNRISARQPFKTSTYDQGKEDIRLSESNWVCRQKNLNSLTLDYCQYKTGRMKNWGKPTYVLDVQNILLKKLRDKSPFSIRYYFKARLNKIPDTVFLVLERPEQYEIKVNGRRLHYKDTGYWIDIAFKKLNITDYILLKGQNIIELRGRFKNPRKPKTLIYVKGGTELESVYLLGNFNVDGRFRTTKEGLIGEKFIVVDEKNPSAPETVTSGYPFYVGEFVFSQEFCFMRNGKRVFLSFDKLDAITLKVTINKEETGLILWPPYRLDITNFLQEGKNLIEIELTNSLRNLLGPHHQRMANPISVDSESFNNKKEWIDGYTFMPFEISKMYLQTL